MDEKSKNYIVPSIILVGIILFAFIFWKYVNFYGSSIQPTSFRSFSVSSDGKTIAIPDVAEFTLSIITEGGKDVASLQTQNTKKSNKIVDFLKSKKIDAKDIKTQSYNLSPRYQYSNCRILINSVCPPSEIVGYSINQSILVKIRDFNIIGDALSGVVQNGANSISQISFTIDDPTKLEDLARQNAINKAKVKAESIAVAGGFHLGRLLSIEEGGGFMPYQYKYGLGGGQVQALSADSNSAPSPTIEAGSQEINVSVTLKYEIQ